MLQRLVINYVTSLDHYFFDGNTRNLHIKVNMVTIVLNRVFLN